MKGTLTHILLLLLLPACVLAQPARKAVPELSFASLSSNRIVFFGGDKSYEKVWKKMDSVFIYGQGNLRIMHLGGSHVQGGMLTRELRNDLLSARPMTDGGRGMMFPCTAAKTNTPTSYISRYTGEWTYDRCTQKEPLHRLGLTGMAVSTTDTAATVTIRTTARKPFPNDPSFRFDKVSVLGYSDGPRVPVVVLSEGDSLFGTRNEAVAAWEFRLPAMADSVKIAAHGREGELTLTGIFLENGRPGISVSEIGVNGAALPSFAKCLDFERDLAMVAPDLVILAIGINDAVPKDFDPELFVSRYRTLVSQIRSVNPDCALLFVSNNDSYRRIRRGRYSVNTNGELARQAFIRLAQEYNAGFWDVFRIMGGLESMKDWEEAGLARTDKIHFTEEGYTILGDLLYNALMDSYSDHILKRVGHGTE